MRIIKNPLLGILLLVLILGVISVHFLSLSAEEARIASRAYYLSTTLKDELGRFLPILFNSLTDYQLPVVSYITALSAFVLGKSEFAVRLPFILFGLGIILLTYKIAQTIDKSSKLKLFSTVVLIGSPLFITISQVPNEYVLLTFFLTLTYFLLNRGGKINKLVFIPVVLSYLTSKNAWIILPPFILITLYLHRKITDRSALILLVTSLILSITAFLVFLQIPQGKRSLLENNFPIFSAISLRNGIEQLRGQGIDAGFPAFLDRLFFNKTHFFVAGIFHLLSHLQPAVLFAQLDKNGTLGLLGMGVWAKVLIIPFLMGLVTIIQKGDHILKSMLFLPFILTLPLLFIFPNINLALLTLSLPFMAIVISVGLTRLPRILGFSLIVMAFFEVGFNLFNLAPQIKYSNNTRPYWVKEIIGNAYDLSLQTRVAISDDIVDELAPFLFWYTKINLEAQKDLKFPYRFRQTKLSNITIIGSENSFYGCGKDAPTDLILSSRDILKIQNRENFKIDKIYKDSLNKDVGFLIKSKICVQ